MTLEKKSSTINLKIIQVKGEDELDEQVYSLKELRARKRKTQAEVAKDLGVSTQTYCAWEKDISNVAVSKVQVVADYYGVLMKQIILSST